MCAGGWSGSHHGSNQDLDVQVSRLFHILQVKWESNEMGLSNGAAMFQDQCLIEHEQEELCDATKDSQKGWLGTRTSLFV